MRVVQSLRRAFPRVQFIASTHDPLCLRGLKDAEVTVLRRSERGRVYAVSDLPPIAGMSAEQLLTSEYFGLFSTVDPETESRFTEYYTLLGMPRLDAREAARLAELRKEVLPQQLLGDTLRERVLLRIIDGYLAQRPGAPGSRADSLLPGIIERELKTLGRAPVVESDDVPHQ
jgi:hypothetical protein